MTPSQEASMALDLGLKLASDIHATVGRKVDQMANVDMSGKAIAIATIIGIEAYRTWFKKLDPDFERLIGELGGMIEEAANKMPSPTEMAEKAKRDATA